MPIGLVLWTNNSIMNLGEHLKSIREKKDLSQKQVALSIGMDPSQYSKIEKGKTDPSVSTVEKIGNALGVPLAELFSSGEIGEVSGTADMMLMEKVRIIDSLEEEEKRSLYIIIDGLASKKKLRDNLSDLLDK